MSAIGALIFDAEGVVVDTEGMWDVAQREFLAGHGRAYDRDAVKHLLAGRSAIEGMTILKDAVDLPGDPAALAAERFDVAMRHFGDVEFVAGFREFFGDVSARYPCALATAMDTRLYDALDARMHLTGLFAGHVVTLADVDGRGKPAPDLFLRAASSLQVEPRACVVLEDAPNGVVAAQRAGMRCIALATTFDQRLLADTGADLVVEAFADVDLDRLSARG